MGWTVIILLHGVTVLAAVNLPLTTLRLSEIGANSCTGTSLDRKLIDMIKLNNIIFAHDTIKVVL